MLIIVEFLCDSNFLWCAERVSRADCLHGLFVQYIDRDVKVRLAEITSLA